MINRIEKLESQVSFQEMTIEELNKTIIYLQIEMGKMKEQLTLISKKIQSSQTSNIASLLEETPPPHY